MNNNKGYYGWIHSLNQAGLQAQQNGARMLNEVNKSGKKAGRPATPFNVEYDPVEHAKIKADYIKHGDEKSNIQRSRTQLQNAGNKVNLEPAGDINQDGQRDANDERDQHSTIPSMIATSTDFPSYNLPDEPPPTREHPAPWYPTPEAAAAAVRALNANKEGFTVNNNDENYDYSEPDDEGKYELPSQNWKPVKESISQKISRILRG